jgi:hypothetical protein
MELFARLLGALLVFVHHCFHHVVIHGCASSTATYLAAAEQALALFNDSRVE